PTAVPRSRRRVCSATVPPQPRISSSGWAAMTTTASLIRHRPRPAAPRLFAQGPAPQHAAVLALDLENHDRALPAGHQLAAGVVFRADHGAEARARLGDGGVAQRRQRGLPHLQAAALETAEGAGVGAGERADEVVDARAGDAPIE